jgi:hypothetical protein
MASAAWQRKAGKNPSGGLNEKGRKSYEAANPGSDLKAPVKAVTMNNDTIVRSCILFKYFD